MAYSAQSNPTSQQQPFQKQQQYPQQQQAPQQQASPYKAPDMSAYAQPSGGYNAYNVPRTAPKGAQTNDLSGNVPSNQIFAQAYNQVAQQTGIPGATSFTMPGSYSSQGYNPTTGQYGPMTGGQSFDGNMAYNAINNRPSPITASATGLGGNQMPWQDAMSQREAFVGNLSQRLGQYNGGQLTGPVTFDQGQLMQQANDQLANGTFYNPFSQQNAMQNPDFQRAMGNSTQYMQGDFQNPFGPQANVQTPSWNQQSYDPGTVKNGGLATEIYPRGSQQSDPFGGRGFGNDIAYPASPQRGDPNAQYGQPMGDALTVPKQWDYSQPYQDNGRPIELAPVLNVNPYSRQPRQSPPQPSDTVDFSKKAAPQPTPSDTVASSEKAGAARPVEPPSQGTPYSPQAGTQSLPAVPAAQPRVTARVQDSYRAQETPSDRSAQAAPAQTDQRQSQLDKIDNEIQQWKAATYGTWKGNGPPAEWSSHIQALQRLRNKAAAGDPAALAWNPKMKAPGAHQTYEAGPGGRGGFNNRQFTGVAGNARPTGYSWN